MSRGRKALAPLEYCGAYHCAGDCGLPHNQQERIEYANAVLAAFDGLQSDERRQERNKLEAVRRTAKKAI